jgi:hypothetical protein
MRKLKRGLDQHSRKNKKEVESRATDLGVVGSGGLVLLFMGPIPSPRHLNLKCDGVSHLAYEYHTYSTVARSVDGACRI